jgi:nucleoside-diphosphate-sugar epimerase
VKVLVTGGGGFVGRAIVRRLRECGHAARIFGRTARPRLASGGVEVVRGDVADAGAVRLACQGVDAVVHAAARVGIWGPREAYEHTNVRGTEAVLDVARAEGVRAFVYTSSPAVIFGRRAIEGGDESLPYPPRHLCDYARTKAAAERAVLDASDGGFRTAALRPHLIWGPGDRSLLPRILHRAQTGRLVRIGDGSNLVSLSYIDNVADAHVRACERLAEDGAPAGRAYFIAEPEPVNCWDFVDRLLGGLGAPRVRHHISLRAAYALGAVYEAAYTVLRLQAEPPLTRFLALQLGRSHWFRVDRAVADLDWRPRVGMEEGLKRLFANWP